jgi:glyoxylase-like metal-dependent hydrolase (beta-lactamase superfamily II)
MNMRTVIGLLMIVNLLCMTVKTNAQSAENVFTYRVGLFEVNTLAESIGQGNKGILIDATAEMLQKYAPEGTFPNGTNAFFIKTADMNILVDAGYGRNLFTNLKAVGIEPEHIDIVLLTHMHGDHIGGMLRDGKPSFPNAQLYLSQKEHDYWAADSRGEQARNVLTAYKSKLHLFQPTEISQKAMPLLPGISAIAAYGHTPGHTAFMVESDNKQLLIWGDVTHAMAIQMPYPQIAVTYDVNPKDAITYRKAILEYVSKNKIPVAGAHITFPGIGAVTPDPSSGGYFFTPAKK